MNVKRPKKRTFRNDFRQYLSKLDNFLSKYIIFIKGHLRENFRTHPHQAHSAFRSQKALWDSTSVIIWGWKGGERGEGEWAFKRLNSLKWKERKGGKEGVREIRRVWEREINGGVSGWEKEGDWKRERDKGEWNRCVKIMNMNTLWGVKCNNKPYLEGII